MGILKPTTHLTPQTIDPISSPHQCQRSTQESLAARRFNYRPTRRFAEVQFVAYIHNPLDTIVMLNMPISWLYLAYGQLGGKVPNG